MADEKVKNTQQDSSSVPVAQKGTAEPESDLALMDLENKTREALREVYDPELGLNVMELGLVRKLDWTPGNVDITMILTTPFCPYGPALIEQVREKVQEVSQRVARVTMGLEMWDPSMMEDQAAANWGLYY
jgi:metal-sulfur cluster biosynthetic enzyme